MESSDEETDSGALGPAYSLTDMLDELGSENTSGVTSPVPSEDSPSHQPTPPPTTTGAGPTTTTGTPTTGTPTTGATTTGTPTTGATTTGTTTSTTNSTPPPGATTCPTTSTTTSPQGPQGQGQPEVKATGNEEASEKERPTGGVGTGKEVGGNGTGDSLVRDTQAAASAAQCEEAAPDGPAVSGGCGSAGHNSSSMTVDTKLNGLPPRPEGDNNGKSSNQDSGIKHSDMNGNAKMGTDTQLEDEPQSDEYSDDAAISKDDPVWKRKKVIKRRKPKRMLNSQSSTGSVESEGSTSSLGSANGLTVNMHPDSKGSTPEREVFSRTCDKSSSGKDVTEKVVTKDLSEANSEETVHSDNKGEDVTGTLKSLTGSAIVATVIEQTGTGNEQIGTGSEPTGTGSEQTAVEGSSTTEEVDNSGYELYEFPQHRNTAYREDIYDNIPDSALYENIAGRSDPRRSTLRRGATLKGLSQEDLVSMTYQGSMKVIKVLPDHPTRTKSDEEVGVDRSLGRTQEGIYESVSLPRAPLSPLTPAAQDDEYDDFSWGSSEFESYDDEDEDLPQDGSQEPISVTVEVKSRSSQEPNNQNVLNKLAAKIGPRSWSREDDEDSSTYLEVTLNMDKHPPPELPPFPSDLTPQQVKRRHIVASIVESERSYTDSLRRIVDEYEKPLLLAKPQIISKNSIKVIFYRLRDILQCHNMFHIELAEYIRVWDAQEKLGNVFTASFSKSMVFDVYSEFVNNFTLAMETAKKLAKQKQAFSDFLKLKIQNSPDKLSLFGLMVKPIQRFPQFILCLQDLLKHTSHDHHDRLALQLALTELETLTHKLNEMKRESENKHEVKKIQSAITGSRFSLKQDPLRCLVRQDDMMQMACQAGSTKSKPRRLFLMNDQLICTTVVQKSPKPPADRDGETGLAEKFKFKWSIPVRDVEVVESEVPDLYQVQGGPGRGLIVAPKLDKSTVSPWKKELDDMMHDLAVVEQLSNLTSQLRLNYPGLNTDLLFGIQRGLQLAIQDQGDLDLCILHLSLPTKYLRTSTDKIKDEMSKHMNKHIPHHRTKATRASRMLHTFQVQSASIKQDWLLELKNAKLSLDPNNKPGWYMPETDQGHSFRLPLFVKPLLIDITKQDTKIQCAIAVVLPSYTNPYVGVQHLWVCSNEARRGQVTIVSLHSNQPHVLESFTACDAAIVCAEYVPGYSPGGMPHQHAFQQDTVWMAMETNELCVRSVVEEERGEDPLLVMDTDGDLTCLRFMDSRLYAGLSDGRLAIYSRDRDGVWHIEDRLLVDLGVSAVNALLPLNHHMWVACDNKVHVVHVTARWRAGSLHHDVKTTAHEVGSSEEEVLCLVKAGVGLMVSFRGRGIIRIYNQETFNHLQDVNVASAVAKVLQGKDLGDLGIQPQRVAVTFMLASKGLLWIGTDCGCTLTLPLPRLEGVPQIKGRPSVSYHAHLGPIKFIVPIHCGPCQLPAPPTSPLSNQSQTGHSENDIDCHSDADGETTGDQPELESTVKKDRPATIILEGATESESNCDDESYDEAVSVSGSSGVVEGLMLQSAGRTDYLSTSMLHLPQHPTMGGRTKWTSTPDLRHTSSTINLNDSEEDVQNLYNNLLQGAEYSQYDDELFTAGKRRRRPHSDMGTGYPPILSQDDPRLAPHHRGGVMGARTHRRASNSKYATLPVLIEDSQNYDNTNREAAQELDSREGSADRSFGTESTGDVSPGVSHMGEQPELTTHEPLRSPSRTSGVYDGYHHAPLSSTPSTMSRITPSHKSLSKSVMIVTGGEGHINWAEKNAGDSKYDDICLLLWQCRV